MGDYFMWLTELVNASDGPEDTYIFLCKELHKIDFKIAKDVCMDQNRIDDAIDLRRDYNENFAFNDEPRITLDGPVSVFEVLVALSKRMADVLDDMTGVSKLSSCFWEMIENLELTKYSDAFYGTNSFWFARNIKATVMAWISRSFDKSGAGSPFPLKAPSKDQRKEEIWYQMMAYLVENY